MWVKLSPMQLGMALGVTMKRIRDVPADEIMFRPLLNALNEAIKANNEDDREEWVDRASELASSLDDQAVNVDEDAVVSKSDEGAWVMSWLFVPLSEVGIACEDCGGTWSPDRIKDGVCDECRAEKDRLELLEIVAEEMKEGTDL